MLFTTGGTNASGSVRKYEFPPGSRLTRAILQSDAFKFGMTQTFGGPCVGGNASPARMVGTLGFSGDLGLTFGHAQIDANLTVSGTQVHVKGALTDLYQWDFEGAKTLGFFGQLLDPMGASLQAGALTLGGSGEVFRVEVQFDDDIGVPPCQCEVVYAGPYQLRVWNTLSESVDVDFIDVVIPGVIGPRPVPFSALMDPMVCEIYGLPFAGTYSLNVYVDPGGPKRNLKITFLDTAAGFVVDSRRTYTLRLARGTCNAQLDAQIQFGGQPVYSVCLQ